MKIAIETHSYAPELNKIVFIKHGKIIGTKSAPGVTTIREAKDKYFKAVKPGKAATVTATYPTHEYSWLNSAITGRIDSYPGLMQFVRDYREKKKGGPLLDGSTLPDAAVSVKIILIG